MTQLTKPGIGNETVLEVNATATNETVVLPNGFATGRRFTVRRVDSGSGGHTVTIAVPSGQYLDDVLNGTISIAGNTEGWLSLTDPGIWQAYGFAGSGSGSGGLTGAGGGAVSTTAQVAADTALLSSFKSILTQPTTYAYNGDGSIASETTGGVTTTYTYNGDGTIATEVRGGVTRTYAYNGDGNVSGVS